MGSTLNDIPGQLIAIAVAKLGEHVKTAQIINWFIGSGLSSKRQIVRFLVKAEYVRRTKDDAVNRIAIKHDLSVEYNLSLSTVNNIIYKYKNIKP